MPPCFDGLILYSREPLPQATNINIRLFTDFSQTTSKFLLSLIVPHTYITTKYSKSLLMHYQHHTPQATKKRRNPKPNIISPSFSNCSNSNFHSSINLIKSQYPQYIEKSFQHKRALMTHHQDSPGLCGCSYQCFGYCPKATVLSTVTFWYIFIKIGYV